MKNPLLKHFQGSRKISCMIRIWLFPPGIVTKQVRVAKAQKIRRQLRVLTAQAATYRTQSWSRLLQLVTLQLVMLQLVNENIVSIEGYRGYYIEYKTKRGKWEIIYDNLWVSHGFGKEWGIFLKHGMLSPSWPHKHVNKPQICGESIKSVFTSTGKRSHRTTAYYKTATSVVFVFSPLFFWNIF